MEHIIKRFHSPLDWEMDAMPLELSVGLNFVTGQFSDELYMDILDNSESHLEPTYDHRDVEDVDCTDVYAHNTAMCDEVIDSVKQFIGVTDKMVLINNPENALSVKQQYKMVGVLREIAKTNQVIVISNSLPIIMSSTEVIDMDKWMWVSTPDYVKESIS